MMLRETMLIKSKKEAKIRHLMPLECLRLVKESFLMAPIHAGNKEIGVFYADRGDSNIVISADQYENFVYFSTEANTGLAKLAASNKVQQVARRQKS